MIYILFLLGIASSFLLCGLWKQNENIIKICIMTWVFYFVEYIVISGILFWINIYTISRAIGIVCGVNIVCFLILYIPNKKKFNIEFQFKKYIIPIIICVCALPCVYSKFEFFGMGQDEGVYQTQAILFINGETGNQLDFPEYQALTTDEEKKYYADALKEQLGGLYNYDEMLPFASAEKELSDVSAVMHGVPTFSAILALWGKMFGISHMSDIQTLFYLCTIFILYFIFEKLSSKKSIATICTTLFAFSPLIIWVSKSALTEIELTCFVASFICLILNHDKKSIYASVLPIIAFCFYHITIYTMIPVILVIYWVSYIYTKRNEYIYASLVAIIAFLAGITMIEMIAGTYAFTYNFVPVYQILPFASEYNVVYIIYGCCILAAVFSIILLNCQVLSVSIFKGLKKIKYIIFYAGIACIIVFQIKIILSTREMFYGMKNAAIHTTLMGFALAAGIFIPIIAGVISLIWAKEFWKNQQNIVILILFLYCAGVYSCIMKPYIQYYYYYARYIAPYIVVILAFSVIMLSKLNLKIVKIAGLLSWLMLLPYAVFWINHKDDTRLLWQDIENFADEITSDDIVVIHPDEMKYYYLPLRAMTGARAYVAEKDYIEQMEQLSQHTSGNVYYIRHDMDLKDDMLETIYQKKYIMSEDNNIFDGKYIPFPKELSYSKHTIILKKLFKEELIYDFMSEEPSFAFDGVGAMESEFCWTNAENIYVNCKLKKKDYTMSINMGGKVPLNELNMEQYNLEVYINNQRIGTSVIDTENNGKKIDINIPARYLIDGRNILNIKMKLWSPSEYGSMDPRQLGIPLRTIEFAENF